MKIANITQQRLREVLSYDPKSGLFMWKKMLSNKGMIGSMAGSVDKNGYIQIGIDGNDYKAHRLAWLYMTGEFPELGIDHINGTQSDNSWKNLRAIEQSLNCQNIRKSRSTNKVGMLGVSISGRKFKAQIMVGGKQHNLGRYETPELAHKVYMKAKQTFHPGYIS